MNLQVYPLDAGIWTEELPKTVSGNGGSGGGTVSGPAVLKTLNFECVNFAGTR